ncbi:HD domain-containing protein [Agrobacterium rosae]|uniref:HD domain-containing protein n=1 Tax=Agrobacterium rosae TaxID=1972867 RepID=UPI001FE09FF4|nr:HD domain-containing protein [Agrobacterium rosae]
MLTRKEQAAPAELVIPFSQKQYNSDLTTTTFGPLEKYVAANDNREGQWIPDCNNPASRGVFVPAEPPRTGDFMQTYTGRQYWPCDPRPHEVFIEDIAHSLSLQCRYAGHCLRFYSVAEHSVLIARSLAAIHAPEVALAGLLHDAPEAYCVDIPRPLKPYLTNYKDIEQKNWLAIAARFQIDRELPDEVHDSDNRIIADELVNLVPMPWHARHNNPLGVRLRYWSPEKAEREFMATFDALMAGRAA